MELYEIVKDDISRANIDLGSIIDCKCGVEIDPNSTYVYKAFRRCNMGEIFLTKLNNISIMNDSLDNSKYCILEEVRGKPKFKKNNFVLVKSKGEIEVIDRIKYDLDLCKFIYRLENNTIVYEDDIISPNDIGTYTVTIDNIKYHTWVSVEDDMNWLMYQSEDGHRSSERIDRVTLAVLRSLNVNIYEKTY